MSSDGDTGPHDLEALARAAFRLSAALQRERDRLARAEGLTSARWQALGELADAGGDFVAGLRMRADLARQRQQAQSLFEAEILRLDVLG